MQYLLKIRDKIFGGLERPANNSQYGDSLPVEGWAFSESSSDIEIQIFIDGNLANRASWGLPRFDVYQKFSNESSYLSGFLYSVDISNLKDGTHTLLIIAQHRNAGKIIESCNFIKSRSISDEYIFPTGAEVTFQGLQYYLKLFTKYGGLKPEHKVLEMGCGLGRKACVVSTFLSRSGSYYGLDIVPFAIDYCTKNISSRFPNFHFMLADVYNQMYNPQGKFNASNFVFPYDDNTFDYVILQSVFTHMIREDVVHYVKEISRVLKPGGISFISYFLLNDNSRKRISENKSWAKFSVHYDDYSVVSESRPEKAIAYDENFIKNLYEKNNLTIDNSIYYGKWSGNKDGIARKDIVIARKH